CGYATDPNYPDKLINLIKQYKLFKYDEGISESAITSHEFVTKNNISDGTKPYDFTTREEVWVMIYRLYKFLNKQ
ncbi:hypothetical protein SAMN02744037_02795, partial [Tepidibacter formicigenes DSM 15518]